MLTLLRCCTSSGDRSMSVAYHLLNSHEMMSRLVMKLSKIVWLCRYGTNIEITSTTNKSNALKWFQNKSYRRTYWFCCQFIDDIVYRSIANHKCITTSDDRYKVTKFYTKHWRKTNFIRKVLLKSIDWSISIHPLNLN